MAEFLTFGIQELLKKVVSLASQEFSLLWGFKGEVTKLRESLIILEAMLRDAEHPRQDQGEAVKLWLGKLENVAHEADDVLDDYGYELLRRKVQQQNQMKKKVHNFFSFSNPVAFRVKMAHRIQKINSSLESLHKMATSIGLVARPALEATNISNVMRINRETYSDFKKDENKIIGREKVTSDIVKALTSSNNNQEIDHISVLAIVGMGGLGKTTVAKSVYHDAKINKHFQELLWVSVSIPFEVNLILRGILESLKPDNAAVQSMDAMCRILKKELKGKKYLLVLDDVWNEDAQNWDDLISCLLSITDTQGSNIIVTTRSDKVGRMVETLPRCDLRKLSDDQCWLILKDKAIMAGSAPITEEQQRIGRDIAKKCVGIPLLAKVLGNMMRSKKSDGWQSIVESGVWDLPEGENRILAILKLSFDELKSPILKQCFAYCSNFIKDFIFEKDDLIQHWMAQGWLHPFHDLNILEMEDMGRQYFHVLLEKSFFEDVRKDSHENIIRCKMHDLVHDLAESVSKSKNFRSVLSNGEVLGNILPRTLRVLNLYKTNIVELPDDIGKLKHLRYLNVRRTKIKEFPKSLGQLYNLQTFKMPYHIEEFPKEIANLISLRHFYFGDYVKIPGGILERLINLRLLPFIKLDKKTGPRIRELGALNHLRDTLKIHNLEHIRDGEEAKMAKLLEKKHISRLILVWTTSRPSGGTNNDGDVLEGLQPHSNLEFLKIKGFMGVKLPSWLLVSNNLKEIILTRCNECEGVPSLSYLPNLLHVKLKIMENLKCLGYEFYGYDPNSDDTRSLFPALKTLHIEEARDLIEWMEVPTEKMTVFPCLEELTLKNCAQLSSAPSHFPSLKKLEIAGMNNGDMPIASILSARLITLTCLLVSQVSGFTCLPEMMLENNKNLAQLQIDYCEDLTCITSTQSQSCCTSLQSLRISGCPKLRYLPDGLHPLSLKHLEIGGCDDLESIPIIPEHGGLPYLSSLEIYECSQLSSLSEGLQYCTSLQRLDIRSCPNITSIPLPRQGLPSLGELRVWFCPELISLPSGLDYSSLVNLSIAECPKITPIPIVCSSLGTSLQSLTLSNLEFLPTLQDVGGFTFLREFTISGCQLAQIDSLPQFSAFLQILIFLQTLKISHCPNLEMVPSLEKLTSLCSLEIRDCPRLTCLPDGLAATMTSSPYCPGFTRLKTLIVGLFWNELDSFPAFQVLSQLESLSIYGWPKLKSLPEEMQHLTSLTGLWIYSFEGLEALPEWLGNLASLESLCIFNCKKLMYLPSIQAMQLTKLYDLSIYGCPLLSERCIEETGPEWPKIRHIQHLQF